LQIFWAEIQAAANMGETEVCRRIATFVLTTPIMDDKKSTAHHYPLLPIFLHVVLPGIIVETDRLPPQEEQTMRVDLMVVVISSALSAAMHLEWALRSVSIPDPQSGSSQSPSPVLGQTSSGMARRMALDLRRNRKSEVSKMMLQRLAASHPFVVNFPVFKSDLGTT
jgi:mediator of RNA polymerase II transcription subunit 5